MKSETHNLDCLDFMRGLPDKCFSLAICDPPYNIVAQQKRGIGSRIDASGKMNEWNHKKPCDEYFQQLFRVSEKQIIWGANNFMLPESEYFIIWNKQQSVPNFASAEYAWTNVKMPAKVFTYSIHQEMQERAKNGGKIHPTQKPVKLYKFLLQNYAKPGDTIFDSHLGSQSSRIAAHDLGFDFVGCELDKEYFDAGNERFARHIAQANLFEPKAVVASQENLFV